MATRYCIWWGFFCCINGTNQIYGRLGKNEQYGKKGNEYHELGCSNKNENVSISGTVDYNNGGVYDIINNIYDLDGNVSEWTLEAFYTGLRAYRGGKYNYAITPSSRDYYYPGIIGAGDGSRLALYIK